MNQIVIFNNPAFNSDVRVITKNNEPYFIAKDVCAFFGDTNYRRSTSRLVDDEKCLIEVETNGGKQKMLAVNESGLYALLFDMQPQKAKGVSQNEILINERISKLKEFKRWVTHEVLPSIRKTGKYELNPKSNEQLIADALIAAERILKGGA